MEFHQVIAISIVIALAFVIDSTVKLFRFRRRNKITQAPWQFRDIKILKRPNDYPLEEARLTAKNWISSAVLFGLIVVFLLTSPESLRNPNSATSPPSVGERSAD